MISLTCWCSACLAVSLFGVLTGPAVGQARPAAPRPASPNARSGPADSTKVYTYAEQMPQLPGYGGSGAAVAAAIRDRLVAAGAAGCGESRVLVAFVVTAAGAATDARIVKGVGTSCDEATLAAVRQLPLFKPGKQNGRPVAVEYSVLVWQQPRAKKP